MYFLFIHLFLEPDSPKYFYERIFIFPRCIGSCVYLISNYTSSWVKTSIKVLLVLLCSPWGDMLRVLDKKKLSQCFSLFSFFCAWFISSCKYLLDLKYLKYLPYQINLIKSFKTLWHFVLRRWRWEGMMLTTHWLAPSILFMLTFIISHFRPSFLIMDPLMHSNSEAIYFY